MTVKTLSISLETRGNADIQDISQAVQEKVEQSGLTDGVVTLFTPSSTSGFTTLEYESGCISDLQRCLMKSPIPIAITSTKPAGTMATGIPTCALLSWAPRCQSLSSMDV